MISEVELIKRIRRQSSSPPLDLLKGIGDDCAVFIPNGANGADALSLITTDTLVEGVHFNLTWHPPQLLGQKAAAVNVSDIAAMGGVPRFALLSLAVPTTMATSDLDAILEGFLSALARDGVSLIGGDTVRSEQGLTLSVTVIGEVERGQVLYRSGAKAGDQIWVSGWLGQAAAGLALYQHGRAELQGLYPGLRNAHLAPQPELTLGRALAQSGLVTAMMDMSDGLASDLGHLCEESGLKALVRAESLPISGDCQQAAQALGLAHQQLAISGGEDYSLLFTAPPAAGEAIAGLANHSAGGQLSIIGEMLEGQGVLLSQAGLTRHIEFQGFDHFAGGRL